MILDCVGAVKEIFKCCDREQLDRGNLGMGSLGPED